MRMWILIVVKAYCQTKKLRQLTFGTSSLLIGRMVSVVKIVTLDLESIEGLAFVKYTMTVLNSPKWSTSAQ